MILVALILCPLFAAAQEKGTAPPPPEASTSSPQAPAPAPAAPAQDAPPATHTDLFKTLIKSVSLDGQIRLRYEYRDPTSYANTDPASRSDDQFLTRIRLNLNFAVTDDIDVFVQPQDQRQWGQEAAVLNDERNLDLHQGYAEIRNIFSEPLTLKGGRMELSYGDQRLVSPLDWSNVGRAWDGLKLRYAPETWWIEGFFSVIKDPIPPSPPSPTPPFNITPTGLNGAAEDQDFMGVYFSYIGVPGYQFDAYGFFREFRDNSFTSETGVLGDLRDRTLGARMKGGDLGFDYSAEAMAQAGHFSSDKVEAYAYAATLGYTADVSWKPRLGVETTYASGDRHAGDGKRGTFDPLYPFGHNYQGYADVFAFKNGRDVAVYLKVQPADPVTVGLDLHNFWLASVRDAWYNAAGGIIRGGDPTGRASSRVGYETDFTVKYTASKFLKFYAGWSHFFAGSFVRETATQGTDTDMNWLFAQMTVDF
jgi:hypothetical protein